MEKTNDNDNIDKIKQKKISIKEDEELQHELKKWEVESTKGGKVINKSTSKEN